VRRIVSRVAARVREERQRRGLSLETLALVAGVSRNSLARFEAGKTGLQLETLVRLVVHGLELDWGEFMASTGGNGRRNKLAILPDTAVTRTELALLRSNLTAALRLIRHASLRAMPKDP
jgi:transcriptional regulator with XRE-family HTH domain